MKSFTSRGKSYIFPLCSRQAVLSGPNKKEDHNVSFFAARFDCVRSGIFGCFVDGAFGVGTDGGDDVGFCGGAGGGGSPGTSAV